MAITIIIPTALKQYAGGSSELAVEAKTIGEALDSLTTRYTELRKHLYSDQNDLRSFVNIYVNDEDIRHAQRLQTPVKDGDTVMIVPSIAGGISTVEAIETIELPLPLALHLIRCHNKRAKLILRQPRARRNAFVELARLCRAVSAGMMGQLGQFACSLR